MASEKDFELLDDYIGNRLSAGDRKAFEEKLRADADLQAEYKIQNHIAESLRKARAAELKAMLNNVPVSAIPSEATSTVKWAAAAGAAVLAVALYFFLTSDDNTPAPADEIVTENKTNVQEQVTPAVTPDVVVTPEQSEPATSADKTEPAAKPSEKQSSPSPKQEITSPSIDVYDPTGEETTSNEGGQTSPAETTTVTEPPVKSKFPTEVNSKSKQYQFHYQFKDSKLILYGDFDKNLYEILEFISDNKRTIFLYYKNSYYLLNQAGDKVKPLSSVNDPALLQKLKEYRSN
jgi:hypothetical protein